MSDTFLVAVEKCPLCETTRRKLTCHVCIRNGNFTHTADLDGETYEKKSQSVIGLVQNTKPFFNCIRKYARCNEDIGKKKADIVLLGHKVQTLQEVIGSLKRDIAIEKDNLRERKEKYHEKLKMLEFLKSNNMESYSEAAICERSFTDLRGILEDVQSQLVKVRKNSIQRLKEDIFPFTTRPVYKDFGTPPGVTLATRGLSNDLIVETSSSPEMDLEEATTCQYKEGEWVQTSLSENEYCIAGCGLPSSGDYVKYFEWMKSYRKGTRGSDEDGNFHSQPGLEIPAALTYTCQVLTVSSKILGISLPFKINYRDLTNPHIRQRKLFDNILKLNKNVIYICFSQLIKPNQLLPMQTLQNLDTCLSECNPFLGHTGNFETYQVEMDSWFPNLEFGISEDCDFLSDDEDNDDGNDDDDSSDKDDWDSLKDLQELPKDISYTEGRSKSTEQFISSSASDLVTSAAASVVSLWPWKHN